MRIAIPSLALLAFLLAGRAMPVFAAPGDLDLTFGNGGFVRDPMPDSGSQATGVAVDTNGRIIVSGTSFVNVIDGNFGVLALNPDGTLDPAFAGGGRGTYDYATGSDEEAYGLVVQADGRIVVGGTSFAIATSSDFAALRILSDGTVDTAFGNHGDGWMTSGRAAGDIGIALAVAPPGGFLLGGYVDDGSGGIDAAGYLLDALGMPVPLFGDNGLVVGDADTNSAFAAAVQPDGKVLLGGHLDSEGSGGGIVLRFTTDGAPDASFAGDGRAELGTDVRVEDLHVLADGRILAAGQRLGDAIVVRLLADGSLDSTFGNAGFFTLSAASQSASQLFAKAIAVQSDGALVVAGTAIRILDGSLLLAFRVTAQGVLDLGFGNAGVRLVDAPNDLFGEAVALQADGAILIAGSDRSGSTTGDQFLVVRLLGGSGAGAPPVLSVTDASLVEGDGGSALMTFDVNLSAPSDEIVSVTVATDLGTATPSVDYTPTTATLTFPAGTTALTFSVPVIGDTEPEPTETFLVRLSAPVNATLGDAVATGSIIDNDAGEATVLPVPGPGLSALTILAGALIGATAWCARRRSHAKPLSANRPPR